MSEYEEQAQQFLKETGTEFKAVFFKHGKHFDEDDEERDIYEIVLKRGDREYKFKFGQSLDESGLRLFSNKERTKRTRHKGFKIPKEIREKIEQAKTQQERSQASLTFRRWFEKEHFSLSGLYWDFGKEPTAYNILASITSYSPDDFNNFCGEYGYDTDSRKAEKFYNAVCDEWKNIQILYSNEEIEKLQEIN